MTCFLLRLLLCVQVRVFGKKVVRISLEGRTLNALLHLDPPVILGFLLLTHSQDSMVLLFRGYSRFLVRAHTFRSLTIDQQFSRFFQYSTS